jgi:hypothetical protein
LVTEARRKVGLWRCFEECYLNGTVAEYAITSYFAEVGTVKTERGDSWGSAAKNAVVCRRDLAPTGGKRLSRIVLERVEIVVATRRKQRDDRKQRLSQRNGISDSKPLKMRRE